MIVGVGIDLVEVKRIENIIARWGERFTNRVFTSHENSYCSNKAMAPIHYAARFAAKESFLKSAGIGLSMGVKMNEIEVRNSSLGKPELILYGRALEMLSEQAVTAVHVTLTHTREHAMAAVILEK